MASVEDEIQPLLENEKPLNYSNDNVDNDSVNTFLLNGDDSDGDAILMGCIGSALCDPRRTSHRFIALFFMCFLAFGSSFCSDSPAALQDNIKVDMGINTTQFANLFAWYSWPNVILCLIGGFLLDRVFGIQLGTVIFASLLLLGQIIFALGGILKTFWVMELGRFIYGTGGESLAVAQKMYAVSWFKGKELTMVFGLQECFSRLGPTANFNVMVPLYSYVSQFYSGHTCTGVVYMIISIACVLCLLSALILGFLDRRANRILKKSNHSEGEVIRLNHFKDFSATFWVIPAICVTYYCAIFPFIGLGQVFFERKFDFSPSNANAVNSIVYVTSAAASPFLGLLIDRLGRNIIWLLFGIIFTVGSHALLAFTFVNPYVGMVTMGFSYSMVTSALWPMVVLIVPDYQLGTAYGIMQAVLNLGIALVNMLAGRIVDDQGYLVLEVSFLGWLCISLTFTAIIWVTNLSDVGILNMSVTERDKHE